MREDFGALRLVDLRFQSRTRSTSTRENNAAYVGAKAPPPKEKAARDPSRLRAGGPRPLSKPWKRPEEQDAGLPDTRRRDPHTTGESPALQLQWLKPGRSSAAYVGPKGPTP